MKKKSFSKITFTKLNDSKGKQKCYDNDYNDYHDDDDEKEENLKEGWKKKIIRSGDSGSPMFQFVALSLWLFRLESEW